VEDLEEIVAASAAIDLEEKTALDATLTLASKENGALDVVAVALAVEAVALAVEAEVAETMGTGEKAALDEGDHNDFFSLNHGVTILLV